MKSNMDFSSIFNQAIIDSIPANIAITDNKSNIIAVNKTWEDFAKRAGTNQTPSCIGLNYLNVCQNAQEKDQDAYYVANGIKEILAGKRELLVHEYPCPIPEGEELWFSLRAAPLKIDGIQQGMVIFHFDITDKKKAEKALERSEKKFRSYVESANDIIFTIDEKGIILYISPNCKNILGYTQKEVTGKNFKRFVYSFDIEKLNQKIGEKIFENQLNLHPSSYLGDEYYHYDEYHYNESIEYRAWHKNGEIKWLSVKTSILNKENNKFEILGIARDITEEKQMEEELEKYYVELEELHEKLDNEVNKAKEIHEKTLPRTFPYLEDISLEAYYKPAETISGDFYNVIKKDDELILYFSDVTGHGLDSAMLNAFIKNTIDAYISLQEDNIDPADLLKFLAKQYRNEGYPDDFFVCAHITVIDLDTNELKYCSAGVHEPPKVSFDTGETTELSKSGLPISSDIPWETYSFDTAKIKMFPGTTILFTTDGLIEQRNGKEMYKNRLDHVFNSNKKLPPVALVELIKNDFMRFNNYCTDPDEDVTFILLQVNSKNRKQYTYTIESDFDEIEPLIRSISPNLPQSEKEQDILIAIHELVVNAIEHGNNLNLEKEVNVEIIIDDNYIMATIQDEGEGFDWEKNINMSISLEESSSERGRGISISRLASDKLFYNFRGNKVFIVSKL